MKKKQVKNCKVCGTKLIGNLKKSYCSRHCRIKFNSDIARKRRQAKPSPIGALFDCEMCGEPAIRKAMVQRYCLDCRKKKRKEHDKKAKEKRRAPKVKINKEASIECPWETGAIKTGIINCYANSTIYAPFM